jgi:hypothetical protein
MDNRGFPTVDVDIFEWRNDWHATSNIATATAKRLKLIIILIKDCKIGNKK